MPNYTKTNWTNDGGQAGGDAALTNLENGVKGLSVGSASTLRMAEESIFGTDLDLTGYTAGANVGLGSFSAYFSDNLTPGASDAACFDPRFCSIVQLDYYTTATGVPQSLSSFVSRRDTGSYLDFSYCGRLATDIDNTLTVVDNTTNIDVVFPNGHGMPLNTEGFRILFGDTGYANSGVANSSQSITECSVIDATTINMPIDKSTWDNNVAAFGEFTSLYMNSLLYMNAGGTNYSTNTLRVLWGVDITHPNFDEVLFGDD